jgi:hypothetical protein
VLAALEVYDAQQVTRRKLIRLVAQHGSQALFSLAKVAPLKQGQCFLHGAGRYGHGSVASFLQGWQMPGHWLMPRRC